MEFKSSFIDSSNKILLDEVDDTTMYIGNAEVGSATSSPVWTIRKVTTSGGTLAVEFANGKTSFSNIWDNRASYSYS